MASPVTPTDYKADSTQGKQRIYGGKFFNPMGGTPSVVLDEQFISYDAVSDKIYVNEAGSCQAVLTDPARPLTLRSPADDTEIPMATFISKLQGQGQFTNEDFFIAFYSLGRRTQLARDVYNAAVKVQAEAQAAYDLEQSEANLAALNAAIALTEAARSVM